MIKDTRKNQLNLLRLNMKGQLLVKSYDFTVTANIPKGYVRIIFIYLCYC